MTSAYAPRADIAQCSRLVRFVPVSEVRACRIRSPRRRHEKPDLRHERQYVAARLRVMIFALRSGAWFQWLSSERITARGAVFGPGARPGLISSGLRGAMGLGVGRVTVAPFSSPIRGTQLGDSCGP